MVYNLGDAKTESGNLKRALRLFKDVIIKFSERTEYVYGVVRQYGFLGEIEDAKLFS